MSRILMINSGRNTQKAFREIGQYRNITFTSTQRLNWYNLSAYDIVIMMSSGDTEQLKLIKNMLLKYVDDGGILLCFGVQAYDYQWVPNTIWQEKLTTEPKIPVIKSEDEKVIFSSVDVRALRYHDFYSHGSFNYVDGMKSLLESNDGHCLMLIKKVGNGHVFATTLDPDYHLAFGIRMVKSVGDIKKEDIDKNSYQFIQNVLNWAEIDRSKKPWRNHVLIYLKSFFERKNIYIYIFIVVLGLTMYKWVTTPISGMSSFDFLANLLTAFAFLFVLYEKYTDYKSI